MLGLLARGMTNKEIAAALFLSAKTVQHHVAHIYDKIDRRTRAGAAMFAMEHRLVERRGSPPASKTVTTTVFARKGTDAGRSPLA